MLYHSHHFSYGQTEFNYKWLSTINFLNQLSQIAFATQTWTKFLTKVKFSNNFMVGSMILGVFSNRHYLTIVIPLPQRSCALIALIPWSSWACAVVLHGDTRGVPGARGRLRCHHCGQCRCRSENGIELFIELPFQSNTFALINLNNTVTITVAMTTDSNYSRTGSRFQLAPCV